MVMTIIINGIPKQIPGLKTTSWLDDPSGVKYISDKTERHTWIHGIVAHTIHGKEGSLLPGLGPNTDIDTRLARYQVNTDRQVSWDFTEDMDGTWLIQNDPLKHYSWQATEVNGITCGFEMVQTDSGDLYEGQIAQAVLFVDALTALLGVQRQIPWDKQRNKPVRGTIKRIVDGAKDVVGIYAHHHQTTNRGPGDPGPYLFEALANAGYMKFDFDTNEDKIFWEKKQIELGMSTQEADGVPGPKTCQVLKNKGYQHGMLISRPVDNAIV